MPPPGPFRNSDPSSSTCTEVYFAHSGFKTDLKLGATPMVTIGRDFLKDGAGSLLGINNKINITGKIYETGNVPGIENVITKEYNLRTLFAKSAGDFEIKYNGKPIFSGINAKVVSYSTDKTSDNWERSIDYSIELEAFEEIDIKGSKGNFRVRDVNETWSIEPEDMVYSSFGITANGTAASDSSEGAFQANVYVTGVNQFRVTRKLSATGVTKDNYVSHINLTGDKNYNFQQQSTQDASNDAYMQAKKWVDSRIPLAFNQSSNQNGQFAPLASQSTSIGGMDLFLCNHTRSINYSITEGTYEVNDSWIALGSGTPFTEEYTIECSTDDKFIKKVNVQGSVKGLQSLNFTLFQEDGIGTPPSSGKGIVSLSGFNVMGTAGTFKNSSKALVVDKYHNALSGWTNDVKKYLYSRASIAINSADRTADYDAKQNTQNPAYRKERVLNHIPISTSEGHDPIKGVITYNYEYNNSFKIFSGVISENVSVTTNGPGDQVAEVFVLGRALGPVLQSLSTKTSTTKSVTIELTVPPPTSIKGMVMDNSDCPFYTGGTLFLQCEQLIEGLKPFGARQGTSWTGANTGASVGQVFVKQDSYQWSPMDGRYTRNVEWIYQPCTKNANAYQFLSHSGQ
jgi:hypothetical protein